MISTSSNHHFACLQPGKFWRHGAIDIFFVQLMTGAFPTGPNNDLRLRRNGPEAGRRDRSDGRILQAS
jgi:hypothetical protein